MTTVEPIDPGGGGASEDAEREAQDRSDYRAFKVVVWDGTPEGKTLTGVDAWNGVTGDERVAERRQHVPNRHVSLPTPSGRPTRPAYRSMIASSRVIPVATSTSIGCQTPTAGRTSEAAIGPHQASSRDRVTVAVIAGRDGRLGASRLAVRLAAILTHQVMNRPVRLSRRTPGV